MRRLSSLFSRGPSITDDLLSDMIQFIRASVRDGTIPPAALDLIMSCGGTWGFENTLCIYKLASDFNGGAPIDTSDDWFADFQSKARNVSDDDMAQEWARILYDESQNPGKWSKRTLSILADMSKGDAEGFRNLCRFSCSQKYASNWAIRNDGIAIATAFIERPVRMLMLPDHSNPICKQNGVDWQSLVNLEQLGLVKMSGYTASSVSKSFFVNIEGRDVALYKDGAISMGEVAFTSSGEQLATLCSEVPNPVGLLEWLAGYWREKGVIVDDKAGCLSRTMDYVGRDLSNGAFYLRNN